jgi:hypothetical protein
MRWLYIMIQGIVLGLLVDVILWAAYDALADAFTRKMNYRTVGLRETMLVREPLESRWRAVGEPVG